MANRSKFVLYVIVFFCSQCVADASDEKVLSSMPLRLLSLQDLKFELNEFQEDCLDLLRVPLVRKAQAELLQYEGGKTFALRISGVSPRTTSIVLPRQEWVFTKSDGSDIEFTPEKARRIVPDKTGYFQFTTQLPAVSKARVPIEFRDKASQSYYLNLELKDSQIQFAEMKPYFVDEQRKHFCTKSRATLALGVTAFSYNQSLASIGGDAKYISFQAPSFSVGVDWARNPESDQSVWYRSAPGTVKLSEELGSSLSYSWKILDYHYSYGQSSWVTSFLGDLLYPRIRLGVQRHELPVMQLKSAQDLVIAPITLNNLTLGFNAKLYSAKHWMFEFQIGGQYPLNTSQKLNYKAMFDGGLGIFASYWPETFVGLQWYGHSHSLTYKRPGEFDATGDVNFIYSSVELSFGKVF